MQEHEIHGNYATPETKYAHVTEYFTGSTFPPLRRPLTLPFWNSSRQVDSPLPNTKPKRQRATWELNNFYPPMGLSGLVRSEGARTEKDSKVKDIKREVRGRAIGSPFLFPLWAMGRAVWIAMLIGSWKYEEITQNPLDFLTPTWVGP